MALAGATLALGLVAGCGSDDDDEPSGGTATEESTPAGGGEAIKVAIVRDFRADRLGARSARPRAVTA